MEENTLLALETKISALEEKIKALESINNSKTNQIIIIVFSQELDKVLSALIIASSAAALGIKVKLFFTFWGINAIKKTRVLSNKALSEKMMAMMSPRSFKHLPISNLNMLGIGPHFLKFMMKQHKILSQEDLMNLCLEEGVEFFACEMTMTLMGISKEEIPPKVGLLGATTIISEATHSQATLFI